jgi:hypothetical protein
MNTKQKRMVSALKKKKQQPDMVTKANNPSTQEAEAGGS